MAKKKKAAATTTFGAPQSRNEAILQNILGANNEILPPESRIEVLLIDLLDKLSGGDGTGGENFTLIENVEITETGVNSIERTGYDFKKVFIRGRIAAGSAGNVQTNIGGFQCGWWSENTNGGVADTFAQIINGMFFSEYGAQLTSLDSPGNNTTLARRELSWGQLTDKNIDSIKITSTKTFPVGTTFEIYGV